MKHAIEDIIYAQNLFDRFYGIGVSENGGVTRLGYMAEEDQMHETLLAIGREEGYSGYHDEVGNTYVCFHDDHQPYTLIGSHLDSVIDGGRYDGVAGVIAGLLILHWAKEDLLDNNIHVGAFRCEESSNFGRCTIGSGLITKEVYKHDISDLTAKNGKTLKEIFDERGYDLNPVCISNVKTYLELHIEQGKVLEEYQTRVGIVTTIAGPRRFQIHIHGSAEHSGATPMDMRHDALSAAAEVILEIESIGRDEAMYQSVATVGTLDIRPNALNVIPGEVVLGVDMRGIDESSLDRMEMRLKNSLKSVCHKRGLTYFREKTSSIPPISMSDELISKLSLSAKQLGISHRLMPSGAGHDAMSFAHLCDTGMVFIPCDKGISHNKQEYTSIESILDGARVMYEYMKGANAYDFD